MKAVDVAVVGAGPFGFSAAASLPQHDVLVFGQPMQTWSTTMPGDMLLRSAWSETSLAAPADAGSIVEWAKREGIDRQGPIPLSVFLAYSEWFRQTFVKELDVSNVARLERENDVFAIRTTVGDLVHARTVVVAVGVIPFSYAPRRWPISETHAFASRSTSTSTSCSPAGGCSSSAEARPLSKARASPPGPAHTSSS